MESSIHSEMGLVYDAAAMDFEHLYIIDKTSPTDDYDELAREDTSLGAFVRRLNKDIDATKDEAERQRVDRARALGVAAFRGREVEIIGLERG